MIVFPQLSWGAGMQFPSRRRSSARAASNRLHDGGVVSYGDPAFSSQKWDLLFRDVTDEEAERITALFERVEGRLGTFTFVDPAANLLAHSEDIGQPCWSRSPMLTVAGGLDDPLGGGRALRLTNGGLVGGGISQQLRVPASFVYAFSVYARAGYAETLAMTRKAGENMHTRTFEIGAGWIRCVLSGAFHSASDCVTFGLEIPAAGTVDLFGPQVESQPCASAYKTSGSRNGVYSSARFEDDTLRVITEGLDRHRIEIRITAKD